MPIDREALMALDRLPFRLVDAKHGPKKHAFRALLEGNHEAAFDVVVVVRFATAKVTLSPGSEASAQALLSELSQFLAQPAAKYSGTPKPARLDAAFWGDPNDPLLSTKLFLHRKERSAEIYFDFDPKAANGWFLRKHLGDEVLVGLLAAAFGMK